MAVFSGLPATAQILIGLLFAYALYSITASITLWRRRQAIKSERGCQSVPWAANQVDHIFGIDLFLKTVKAVKNHTMLATVQQAFLTTDVKTMQFVTLGVHMFRTIEPENLKTIQAIDHAKWGLPANRKAAIAPLFGKGIFTNDGAAWQHSRDMLRPNFVRSQVGDVLTFEKHVSPLIKTIQESPSEDLSELFFLLSMDSATEFLFGQSTDSLSKNSEQRAGGFGEAFDQAQKLVSHHARFGKLTRLFPADKRFKQSVGIINDFVDKFVIKALDAKSQSDSEKPASENGRYVFIDELVRQTNDPVVIRSELLNVLLAGRDTTASLLTNVFFTISQRPEIWQRLQADVQQLNGALPTFEQLKDLKYVKAVLNESLRCHPIVPINSRQALEDTILPLGGGPDGKSPFFAKKGSIVSWNLYVMHRRKDLYGEDAEEFKPERWLDNAETGQKGIRPTWEYLPFNGGARICIGQQFGLAEASYTVVRLCQAFSGIKCNAPGPWIENVNLTCMNLSGAKVTLTPRAI
ncbi:related to n-alkane-inducible cytochrome P450 [Ramularia collo-cygni]|uniref:Related to n-alkane-inducible cytochrome P450 n=1 Tax=Ramularia collo-cygni TaxID=112498 RepID=A0A2D3VGL2_9PEZI|nr:related to n-alkane-inducible cytochrome P450 [Ramularia collo-cygni]CZT21029.1 related to n-alkane-inducible cytochrome P450 [Ramularia collo-cygni]